MSLELVIEAYKTLIWRRTCTKHEQQTSNGDPSVSSEDTFTSFVREDRPTAISG